MKSKKGKTGDDLLSEVDLETVYSSAFDAVLYGSESVVQKYVDFRMPNPNRDSIDVMRSLAGLLLAMREDVTGKKPVLAIEHVLGTFMNLSNEEILLLHLREHVTNSPEAHQQLNDILKKGGKASDQSQST